MAETFGADVCAVDSGGTSDRHTGRERASEIQTKRQFIGSLENSHRKKQVLGAQSPGFRTTAPYTKAAKHLSGERKGGKALQLSWKRS